MSNRFVRRTCTAAYLCAAAIFPSVAFTQTSPDQTPLPMTAPEAAAPPVKPLPRSSLTLLQYALAPLLTSPVVDSESNMSIFASKAGAVFTLREHLKVTARRPGRFVSEVTLLPTSGSASTTYQIASDGVKVTTYRPGVAKYSVAPLAQFQAGDEDFPSLGLIVGLLYLGDTSFIKGMGSLTKDSTGQSTAMLRKTGMALTSRHYVKGDINAEIYTLQLGKIGQYRFYVDTATGQLSQVELRTVQDGVQIRMVEKILTFTSLPSVSPDVFKAQVPPTATKVKQLAVGYF